MYNIYISFFSYLHNYVIEMYTVSITVQLHVHMLQYRWYNYYTWVAGGSPSIPWRPICCCVPDGIDLSRSTMLFETLR